MIRDLFDMIFRPKRYSARLKERFEQRAWKRNYR
jgi:hypothetical protein